MSLKVADNPAQHRFEVRLDGELAGFAQYELKGNRITLVHTEVEPEFSGRGVGSALARGTLNIVCDRRLDLVPTCEFMAGYVAHHPDEYLELVPVACRNRVMAYA